MTRRRLAGAAVGIGLAAALAGCSSTGGYDGDDVGASGLYSAGDTADVCMGPGGLRVDDGLCGYPHPGYGAYVYQVHPGGVLVPAVGQRVIVAPGAFTPAPPAGSPAYRALGRVYVPTAANVRAGGGPNGNGTTGQGSSSVQRGGLGVRSASGTTGGQSRSGSGSSTSSGS